MSSPRPIALIRFIHGTGAFITVASAILGCWILALIVFAMFRTHPFDSLITVALLLLAWRKLGLRRTRNAIAIIFAITACYFFGSLAVAASHGQFIPAVDFGWFGAPLAILGAFVLLILTGAMFGLIVKKGYDMWRRIDNNTVADFASVFALFAARVFHYAVPSHLPTAINDHLWVHLRDPFSDRGSRMLWTWLAVYVFYKLMKTCLFRILDLNPQSPPSSSAPNGPDKPFVPFDPYDLAKNSPIRL